MIIVVPSLNNFSIVSLTKIKITIKTIRLLELPAIGGEEKMDGLVAELISTLQVFIDNSTDRRCSLRELDEVGRLIQGLADIILDQGALSRFTASITAFKSDKKTTMSSRLNS